VVLLRGGWIQKDGLAAGALAVVALRAMTYLSSYSSGSSPRARLYIASAASRRSEWSTIGAG